MFKLSKIFVAIMLVVLIGVSSFTVALANDDNNEAVTQLTIVKNLRMPAHTATPQATFTFNARLVSVDDSTDASVLAGVPALNNLTVSFTDGEASPAPVDNVISFTKETGNIFDGVDFPHAGVFVFEIRENPNTNPAIDNDLHDVLIYSDAVYTVTVYVANVGVNNDTQISSIIVTGGSLPVEDDESTEKANQLVFVNDFVRTHGPEDPRDPDPVNESTLLVSKAVAGDFASREHFFDFTIGVTVPSLFPTSSVPTHFRAYVVENGAVVADLSNNADAGLLGSDLGGPYIRVSTSQPTNFSLRHGQRLVFVDTPVGTSYTVTEAQVLDYTTSIAVVRNVYLETITGRETGLQFVGEPENTVAYTNTRDFTAPMGLSLNDLPFIGLILLAVGALVAYIVVKTRKARKNKSAL